MKQLPRKLTSKLTLTQTEHTLTNFFPLKINFHPFVNCMHTDTSPVRPEGRKLLCHSKMWVCTNNTDKIVWFRPFLQLINTLLLFIFVYITHVHSLVDRYRDRESRNTAFKRSHSKRARISSLADVLAGPELLPLEGGVFRSGGSKYDRSSIGSTLSGNNCKENGGFSFRCNTGQRFWATFVPKVLF